MLKRADLHWYSFSSFTDAPPFYRFPTVYMTDGYSCWIICELLTKLLAAESFSEIYSIQKTLTEDE